MKSLRTARDILATAAILWVAVVSALLVLGVVVWWVVLAPEWALPVLALALIARWGR